MVFPINGHNGTVTSTARALSLVVTFLFTVLTAPLAHGATPPAVYVWSQGGELTADTGRLHSETAAVGLPPQVTEVDYLVFSHNDANFNDTVLNHAKQNKPDMLSADQRTWAPGHLIVGLGLDPHKNGLYCADDVCQAMQIDSVTHLSHQQQAINAGKDDFRAGRYADGLLAAVRTANKPAAAPVDSPQPPNAGPSTREFDVVQLIFSIAIPLIIVVGIANAFRGRGRSFQEQTDYLRGPDYAALNNNLSRFDDDAAHLSPTLFDPTSRSQWWQVRHDFDSAQQKVNAQQQPKRSDVGRLYTLAGQVEQAGTNIGTLRNIQDGDAPARLNALDDLRDDLSQARRATRRHKEDVDRVAAQVKQLRADAASPNFTQRYLAILDAYSSITRDIAKEKHLRGRSAALPAIYDPRWSVGTGIYGFVPFGMFMTWHDDAISTAWSSGSAGSDFSPSFSDSGFSGDGGSSSW